LAAGPEGLLRSEVFPGLWLDSRALIAGDLGRVQEVLRAGTQSPQHAAFVARLLEARRSLVQGMEYLWLCLAAAAAGAVNAIAGGGTLLTFPTLLFTGISSVFANATSTVALLPGSVASAWGYRNELRACGRWVSILTIPSLAGGGIGAALLIFGGEKVFNPLIPWLILGATLLLLLQPAIARFFRRHHAEGPPTPRLVMVIVLFQLLIGIYGGYFGAGIGILMLSSLAFLGLTDIHHVNALKTYLAFCMNGVSALMFIGLRQVHWDYAGSMALAAVVGGYVGARLALKLPPALVRGIVVAIGFAMAGYYFVAR